MTKMTRSVAALLVGAALSLPAAVATSTPSQAQERIAHYVDWNICGWVCNQGADDGFSSAPALRGHVIGEALSDRAPIGISLQEVCHSNTDSQANYNKYWLGQLGYVPGYLATKPTGNTGCSFEGIQTLAYGAFSYLSAGFYTNQSDEDRGLICLETLFGGYFTTCSTHLESGDVPTAGLQLVEASWVVSFILAARPDMHTYLGGDLNLGYQDTFFTPTTPYQYMWEANGLAGDPDDAYNTGIYKTHDTNECDPEELYTKYDYSFVDRSHFSPGWITLTDYNKLYCGVPPPPGGGAWLIEEYSDHHLVGGHFPIT